jgi:glyceraldehyde-3-phosphate dehydrogenase (NADP+)
VRSLVCPVSCQRREVRSVGLYGQGITNSINLMCKTKSTVINLPEPSYTMG